MCHLKVTLGLGDYIKSRKAYMKEEKEKNPKKYTHLGLCEFPVVEGVSQVLSNKKRVYYVF